ADLTVAEGRITAAEGDIDDLELALPSGDDYLQLEEQASPPANPSSGFKRIYADTDGKVYQVDSNGIVRELGSGSGGGGFMPLLSGDDSNFEGTIGNWVTYKDTAGAQPEDGTGGTATAITFTRVTDV